MTNIFVVTTTKAVKVTSPRESVENGEDRTLKTANI